MVGGVEPIQRRLVYTVNISDNNRAIEQYNWGNSVKKQILMALLLSTTAYGTFAADFMKPNTEINQLGKHVVINIPQLRLFVYENGKLAKSYPIAVGKGKTQTPPGEYEIGVKAFNPTWHIPASIQKERASKGLPAIKTIAPGPKNPLGPVFVRFGDPKLGLGIHGTSAPSSVPSFASHGCVRLRSENALEFAKYIDKGSRVSVIYQQAVLNLDGNNNVWLSVYKDPYNLKAIDAVATKSRAQALASKYGKSVNDKLLTQILANKSGQLNCLTCVKGAQKVQGNLRPVDMTFKALSTPPVDNRPSSAPSSAPINEPGDSGDDYIQPHNSVDWSSQVESRDSMALLW